MFLRYGFILGHLCVTVGLVGDLPVGLGMGVEEIMLTVSENVFVGRERHQIGDV